MSNRSLSTETKQPPVSVNHSIFNSVLCFPLVSKRQILSAATKPLIQPKLKIGAPNDKYEQEADRVADQVMRMPDPSLQRYPQDRTPVTQQITPLVQRQVDEEEEQIQMKAQAGDATSVTPEVASSIQSLKHRGRSLAASERNFFESRFARDFTDVRVHTDNYANKLAQRVNARAFTVGKDVMFDTGQYQPHSNKGRRLMAHELTHVVQQGGGREVKNNLSRNNKMQVDHQHSTMLFDTGDEAGNNEITGLRQTGFIQQVSRVPAGQPAVQRQNEDNEKALTLTAEPIIIPLSGQGPVPNLQRAPPPAPAPVRPASVAQRRASVRHAILFLDGMVLFVSTLSRIARTANTAQRAQSAHQSLNQTRIRRFLTQAKRVYQAQLALLPTNDPLRVQLRSAYIKALDAIRRSADAALSPLTHLSQAVQNSEQVEYWENMGRWIEASPMTSTRLIGTTTFTRADIRSAASYEAVFERYLDDLLRRLPGSRLTQARKNNIYNRIQIAMRRAFITVKRDAAGNIIIQGISNRRIVRKYQKVSTLLEQAMSGRQQMRIIRVALPAYVLPNPVPNVTNLLNANANIGTVDLSNVPTAEVPSVRYGILQAANTVFPPGSQARRQNAYWPVTLQIRQANNVVRIRYELVFDNLSNVRAERLGEARARAVASAFARLSVANKKRQLIADFRLAAVDDRPAHRNRPAARWTGPELDQVKAAFDMIPTRDKSSLRGVTLVRDHRGPARPGAQVPAGHAHTGRSHRHDQPGPAPHGPPHIHYYNAAFRPTNRVLSVGAPGATGPGGDWWLLHEVGHFRIFRAGIAANRAITVSNRQIQQTSRAFIIAVRRVWARLNRAQRRALRAWRNSTRATNRAIRAYNQAVRATPPQPAQIANTLRAAQQAVRASRQAHAALAAVNIPQRIIVAAANVNAANLAMLTASRQLFAANQQIPIFVHLAGRFRFHRITEYARAGGDSEWFAETYSLYLTDPNRLNQMNRSMFLWFAAGMPMNRNWNPPP